MNTQAYTLHMHDCVVGLEIESTSVRRRPSLWAIYYSSATRVHAVALRYVCLHISKTTLRQFPLHATITAWLGMVYAETESD